MTRKNTGKASQQEFEVRFRGHVIRVPDAADLTGLNGGRPVADFPKPSDYLAIDKRGIQFAEVKSSQNATSFPYGNIEKGQRAAATLCALAGAMYFFYLHNLNTREWHLLTAAEFVADIKAGKGSRKWTEIPKHNWF